MSKLIDARTSQNASYANSIAIVNLVINTPQLVGQIGLITEGVGAKPRVLLNGTLAVQLPLLPLLTTVTITIVRGTLPTDPLVYSAAQNLDLSILGPQIFTVAAADYLPPITPQLTYSMFVSSSLLGTIRVGPESFNGTLVSD
ncbi:hypothetical protein [Paenibacillus rigui]|uniref:Uncharacterized protein n=1 Tax=Paenibacillus rigui TaxID=554312 RepID=A0A229USE1_9BACL|nr:hypothetical protein [Paenibacillus rigui]OXM86314.1 hypothetical protein CF651_10285 [Paenibacillus rigui]